MEVLIEKLYVGHKKCTNEKRFDSSVRRETMSFDEYEKKYCRGQEREAKHDIQQEITSLSKSQKNLLNNVYKEHPKMMEMGERTIYQEIKNDDKLYNAIDEIICKYWS